MTPRCSVFSRALDEPLAGTAASAAAWLCLEQPGPWGREALVESHLDPALGAELGERAKQNGVRILLIRRPGRHADTHVPTRRRVYLAATTPGASWLEETVLADPADLLELDFAALGQGRSTAFGTPCDDPLLMVCTNSKRDVCCALYGRPVAVELDLWECTGPSSGETLPFWGGFTMSGTVSGLDARGTISPASVAAHLPTGDEPKY